MNYYELTNSSTEDTSESIVTKLRVYKQERRLELADLKTVQGAKELKNKLELVEKGLEIFSDDEKRNHYDQWLKRNSSNQEFENYHVNYLKSDKSVSLGLIKDSEIYNETSEDINKEVVTILKEKRNEINEIKNKNDYKENAVVLKKESAIHSISNEFGNYRDYKYWILVTFILWTNPLIFGSYNFFNIFYKYPYFIILNSLPINSLSIFSISYFLMLMPVVILIIIIIIFDSYASKKGLNTIVVYVISGIMWVASCFILGINISITAIIFIVIYGRYISKYFGEKVGGLL